MKRENTGFTLIELMVSVAIMAIIITIGVPAFGGVIDNQRVKSVVDTLVNDLRRGRTEAVLAGVGETVSMQFTPGGSDWSYVLASSAESGPLLTRDANLFSANVGLSVVGFDGSGTLTFPATRKLSSAGQGTIDIKLGEDIVARVARNMLGGISVCSPSGSFGYASC